MVKIRETREEKVMKIVVLNGSPKGDISVTMQYVAYHPEEIPGTPL